MKMVMTKNRKINKIKIKKLNKYNKRNKLQMYVYLKERNNHIKRIEERRKERKKSKRK
jgi:2-phosphoglycerate kinase